MMMTNPSALFYNDQRNVFDKLISNTNKKLRFIVYLRLSVFLSGLALVFILVWQFNMNYLLAAIPFLAYFIYLVKRNEGLRYKKQYFENCKLICGQEINALKGDYSCFDPGTEFIELNHPYSSDFDIFGKNSIFQFLNRTTTSGGKMVLADWLKHCATNDEILLRQESVRELSQLAELRIDFRAAGLILGDDKEKISEILAWMEESPDFYSKPLLKNLIVILPIITLISLVLGLTVLPFEIFILSFLIQLGFTGLFIKKINHLHASVSKKFNLISQTGTLLQRIESNNFTTEKLLSLQYLTKRNAHSSAKQIGKLSTLIRLFDNRLNMMAALFLNGLLSWDLHCSVRLEKWRAENYQNIKEWLNALHQFDALCSLSNLYFNNPEFIFPEISLKKHEYHFIDCGHILISGKERVTNSMEITGAGKIAIITGSNMAGKSTFLRTVGVNLVLAMAGAPVCAKEFSFYPVQLFSSMRLGDDLSNRESTFYAELKRLKQILDEVKNKPVFIVLDEILKGTNSTDKLTGSVALLKELSASDSVAIIATHDLALAELENKIPDKVKNYNFEVEIRDHEFYFDYKLKNGICKVLNANELMKKMGLKI